MPKPENSEILQAGHIVDVHFQVALPVAASKSDILEWVMFNLGFGSMATANPLADHDIETLREPVLSDSGTRLATEIVSDPARPGVVVKKHRVEKV